MLFQVCTLAMQFTKANPCEVESIREQKKKKKKKNSHWYLCRRQKEAESLSLQFKRRQIYHRTKTEPPPWVTGHQLQKCSPTQKDLLLTIKDICEMSFTEQSIIWPLTKHSLLYKRLFFFFYIILPNTISVALWRRVSVIESVADIILICVWESISLNTYLTNLLFRDRD